MKLYTKTTRGTTPALLRFPERLQVVRAASVRSNGVRISASAFVSNALGCWRPSMNFEDARPVSALDALRRHAEVHTHHVEEERRCVPWAA